MAIEHHGHLAVLQDAFRSGRLTFYLGAGVSKPSGLPSWEELVQALYCITLRDDLRDELIPYPNYLFALAEWVLKQKNEPLDIITRKMKQWYKDEKFIEMMSKTLYAGLEREAQNDTLKAILDCCMKSVPGASGLHSIITYNYDNLLELELDCYASTKHNFQVIYKHDQQVSSSKIPIYHVHGYIPYKGTNIKFDDMIFSEDQYNRAFQNSCFWGNKVQVSELTSTTGLMIGMSLSDRNTRRILDSIRSKSLPRENFILMRRPHFATINDPSSELDQIHQKAQEYLSHVPQLKMKLQDKKPQYIQQLLENIYQYESSTFEKGFENIGLHLITFDNYDEIPLVLQKITEG